MVSVSEATSIIESHLYSPRLESVNLSEAPGRILGEEIIADRDLPPFDRVAMDGIAISLKQFDQGQTVFPVEGVAAAGQPRKTLSHEDHCYEVMTGAPLPIGTDAVIRYEDIEILDGKASVKINKVALRQNVHGQGQDAKHGTKLLLSGTKLSPAEIALIATVGKSSVQVKTLPNAAIISTGDELVAIDEIPEPHQIRRSNSSTLQAALMSLSCKASLYHLRDEKEKLEVELRDILNKHELIILTGGVSKGKFDFIPEVLEGLGVKKHFHKVK
ncbi:MAG: molybdopterin molybdotransferase MoeA, partial [Cyclobacteriaceae bacterium]